MFDVDIPKSSSSGPQSNLKTEKIKIALLPSQIAPQTTRPVSIPSSFLNKFDSTRMEGQIIQNESTKPSTLGRRSPLSFGNKVI